MIMRRLILIALCLGLPFPVFATTYYVSTTGSDSNSCTAASNIGTPKLTLGSASVCPTGPDDMILLRAGTYVENTILFYNTVGIASGSAGHPIIIQSYPSELATIQASGSLSGGTLLDFFNVTYWTIQNLKFDGNGTVDGIIRAENCNVCSGTGEAFLDGFIVINNNEITRSRLNGVAITNNHSSVTNNHIHGNGTGSLIGPFGPGYGIYMQGTRNLIDHNEIDHNGRYAMQLYSQVDVSFVTVSNNNIHENDQDAAGAGFIVGGGFNYLFNNLIWSNASGSDGIQLSTAGSNNNFIYNNTIYNNPGYGINALSDGSTQTVQNNIVYNNGNTIIDSASGTNTFNHNVCNAAGDGCSTIGNPLFVNPPTDFHLSSVSSAAYGAAIDISSSCTANTISGCTTDYYGVPRGPRFDGGAIQFSPPPIMLFFNVQPSDTLSGGTMATVIVTSNSATLNGQTVSLAISGCAATATGTGATLVSQAATFSSIVVHGLGTGCIFTASTSGAGSAVSTTFNVIDSSDLLTGIISYWKMNEFSGNAIDSADSNDLTGTGSPGTAAGIILTSRTFNGTTQYFSRPNNTSLQTGNVSFSINWWVYLTSKANAAVIMTRWDASTPEYLLYYNMSLDRFVFDVFDTTGADYDAIANNFGSPPLNTWTMVTAWYNSATAEVGIKINAGTPNTTTAAGTRPVVTTTTEVGDLLATDNWVGRLDEGGFWKNKVLSTADISLLYNSGAGCTYPFNPCQTSLSFNSQPSNTVTGHTMSSFIVAVSDTTLSGNTMTITINGCGAAISSGSTSTIASNSAAFTPTMSSTGSGCNFVASATGATSATSSNFNVTSGVPPVASSGASFGRVKIRAGRR